MNSRTTQTVVRFSSPFLLPGFEVPQPAGDYRVDYDEELLEGVFRLAWRRIAAFVYLPAIAMQGSAQQMVAISMSDLETILEKHRQQP
ncbi:hypothetical protein [Rhizobium leucaenae]|uniref:Uncharacterized protein n=1 Tax=Rhizobium leucaenae TaxID=29450 RepID=A0A7W6ZQ91_9HYPH|nr:hypothetical protein [Rhizobium leucaenae]MBB4566751.1 hypothetical protein [Rhizobium leucaenae]MBB6301355.1 hypothetical protein [Rhizobium leucaenae]